MKAVLAAALAALCLAKLLACLLRHSVAILLGGVVLLAVLGRIKSLTK